MPSGGIWFERGPEVIEMYLAPRRNPARRTAARWSKTGTQLRKC